MKILIAEDDLLFQVMLQRSLQKSGYDVILVGDGEQAWRHLNSPGGPRLALLDWVMPAANGLEVCRRVRSGCLPHYVYIILLTAKTDSQDLVAAFEGGADDYLVKPVRLDELNLRLRAGCRVLESEEQHRNLAETASDGIVTVDHEGLVHFSNAAAGQIFGLPAKEMVGRDFSSLIPDFDRHLGIACVRSALSDPSQQVRSWPPIEIRGLYRSGAEMTLEVSFSESLDSANKRLLTAMIRDVTERRSRENQRARAQKLESIGQLAAGVAHEINTPIQYIGDNLRFLEESHAALQSALRCYQGALDAVENLTLPRAAIAQAREEIQALDLDYLRDEVPSAIHQALEGVGHVREIVRAMKEFSHPGSIDVAPVDLNHAIINTTVVSRNEWKYAADLDVDLDPTLPLVECVAGEMGQVILNLIVNAVDAISEAGKGRPGHKGRIVIRTRLAGEFVEITVADSGTGIPAAARAKVFDPFFTTKDVGRGSGQGLAIAHSIVVQRHRGMIEFETAMGVGTTFKVRLPLKSPCRHVAVPAESAAESAGEHGRAELCEEPAVRG